MPLRHPERRELSHTRTLEIKGYQRADGLFDIEGVITDTKTMPYPMLEKTVAPGEPVHRMWLRLSIDKELMIHASEAWTEVGPYRICAEVNPRFERLAGIRIGSGWRRKIRERIPAAEGCTHILEMLGQMGTTAMQTIWAIEEMDETREPEDQPPAYLVDSCHAWRAESPTMAAQYPNYVPPRRPSQQNQLSESVVAFNAPKKA